MPQSPSRARSATSPSSATAGSGRPRSSRRCSSRRGRRTGSGRSSRGRPSRTGTTTSTSGRCRSPARCSTSTGRTARSTSSTARATPASRPTRSPRCASSRARSSSLSAVMGVEVNTSRVWKRADEYELSRVVFVNMLDRERADFFRVLEAVRAQLSDRCVAIQLPIGAEHEVTGIVDLLHMCAYMDPVRRQGGRAAADPRRRWPTQVQEYREKLLDAVVETNEDLMARYLEGEELPAEDVAHALKDAVTRDELYPGRLRRRDEEPRHDRAARPARRGRAVAGEEGHDDRVRRREAGGVRLQDDRRPVRRADQLLSRPRRARSRATRRSSIRARTRRSGSARSCC